MSITKEELTELRKKVSATLSVLEIAEEKIASLRGFGAIELAIEFGVIPPLSDELKIERNKNIQSISRKAISEGMTIMVAVAELGTLLLKIAEAEVAMISKNPTPAPADQDGTPAKVSNPEEKAGTESNGASAGAVPDQGAVPADAGKPEGGTVGGEG